MPRNERENAARPKKSSTLYFFFWPGRVGFAADDSPVALHGGNRGICAFKCSILYSVTVQA